MYPSDKAMQRPEVRAFMDFILENADSIAEVAAIVPTSAEAIEKSKTNLAG